MKDVLSSALAAVIAILQNDSFRRWLVGTLTAALVALSSRVGIPLSSEQIAALVTVAVGYIVSSNMKAAAVAKAAASLPPPAPAPVKSVEDLVNQ